MQTNLTRSLGVCTLLLSFVAVETGHAGMVHEDCRDPFIYRDAEVNVVVLPYRYVGEDKPIMTETGLRLATLIQLHSLFRILRYGSVGAVQMEMPKGQENDPRCEPETVWAKLMGDTPGASEVLPPQHGLVMIWGLIYEQGNDIYLKSYARFARRNTAEDMTFRVSDANLVARPSADTVSFSPQLLSHSDLTNIEASYSVANMVRPVPDKNVPGQPFPNFLRVCPTCPVPKPGFYVEETKGSWIRIRWIDQTLGSKNGWISAEATVGSQLLDKLMPELDFVAGTVGYLRFRAAERSDAAAPQNTIPDALSDFDSFREKTDAESRVSRELSLELSAMLLARRNGSGDLNQAAELLRQAELMTPESGAARNLSACVQIWQEWTTGAAGENARSEADQFIAATILDSHSKTSLSNLRTLYQLLLKNARAGQQSGLSNEEIETRLKKIDSVQPGTS